ncbi:MAG: RNA polymerase sigma-70 factor [Tannerella sp.]|jgi:RNA polymerase sigma-70 factor (ECF subfamily)|nr:RNA polymerase sigma-70 factor [Tannerella sp.]
MEIIDEALLERFREGDHKAFESIFLSYYDRVKNFINGLIKSEDDAEELAQDVFVRLWTNRQAVDPGKPFHSWLYTVARNAAFNYLKRLLVHKSYVSDYLATHQDGDSSVEETLFAKEIGLLIEMTVQKMPSRRRDIYMYSRVKGYSNGEIARKLNISKKTVENQLSLAFKEIRKVIYLFIILIAGPL